MTTLSPTPQTQATATLTQRLGGDWLVRPLPLDPANPQWTTGPIQDWITIPECAHLQPSLYPEQPYWGAHLREINQHEWLYRRDFTLPEQLFSHARLHFEGVDYFAAVWLNGHYVGEHEGHFAPFDFDVTGLLRPDAPNRLEVRVRSPWDPPNPNGIPPMNHIFRGLVKGLYEHSDGIIPPDVNPLGIWRPTWLILDQGIHIEQVRIQTDLDGTVRVQLQAVNVTDQPFQGDLLLDIAADNHAGPGTSQTQSITLPPGTTSLDGVLTIPEPRWWWPWDHGEPNLYQLTAHLRAADGQILTDAAETFGVRTVRLERALARFTYWINERPVFVRGTSYLPDLYLSQVTRESLAQDIQQVRAAHLNLLRAHIHVSPPEFYDLCDREGMLVWQDFELNWIHDSSPEFEARARRVQRDMIDLLGNHPSVVTWACHNEPTMIFTQRRNLEVRPDLALYADAQQQDATRPVFICSGQMEADWQRAGDSHSYFGAIWSQRYTDVYQHRPRLSTEFGFEAPAALDTLRSAPQVWERTDHLDGQIEALWGYQARLIQYHVEHFRRLRADTCAGYVHFWFADLVPQIGPGVLDSQRRPKGGYAALQRASQPLLPALEHDGQRPLAWWIFNDTPQAYPGATLHWRVYDAADRLLREESLPVDLAANTAQRVADVRGSLPPEQCARIDLNLYGPDGDLLASNTYDRPFQPHLRPRGYPWKFDPDLGMKVFDRPGAPSLTDRGAHPAVKLVPLTVREWFIEWVLRQQFPTTLLSAAARVLDRL